MFKKGARFVNTARWVYAVPLCAKLVVLPSDEANACEERQCVGSFF